jgi:hypothetical protein
MTATYPDTLLLIFFSPKILFIMKKVGFISLILNLFVFAARAQAIYGGMGGYDAGLINLNLSNVNARLNASDYPALRETVPTFGGSGYGIIRNIVVGGEGFGFFQPRTRSGGTSVSYGGGQGLLHLGYVVKSTRRLLVFPTLGIGGGGMGISRQAPPENPSFDQALNRPRQTAGLGYGSMVYRAALHSNYFLKGGPEQTKGVFVGVSAGYTFSATSNRWYSDGESVTDGPGMSLSGFFATLTIGGGGLKRK